MKYQNKRFQNIGILIVVAVFLSLAFIGSASSAQTRNRGKATPTPKSKKATPTPKKNAKATPTSNKKSNQKTTAKTKPTPTPKKKDTKTTSKNDKNSKSKTVSTKDKNAKSKTDTKNTSKKTTTTLTKNTKPTVRNTKTTTTSVKPKTNPATTKTPKTTAVQPTKELMQIVVSAPSQVVRSAPNASASEVGRARFGAIYGVVDKSSGWYKIQIPNRTNTVTGWIPVTVAVNSDKNGNDEIYRQVLAKYPVSASLPFSEFAELYEFLTRVQPEIKDANTAAEFGLKRLTTLRSALHAIPQGQSNQKIYQDFIKAQDENIVYSDPSAEWYVRAPLFWDLHSKYTATPSGEKIAWEAARNPLPGECEGYVNCYIFLLRMTDGEYLNFYPSGTHSTEALRNITTSLQPIAADADAKKVYNGPTDVSDRAEFNSLITELRVIISRLPSTEKERALQQLKKIAEGFK